MKLFDYSFLKTERISNNVLSLFIAIEKIQGLVMLNFKIYPEVFKNLEKIAKVQSIKASNAIEGIVTSDKRIKSLLNKEIKPINHDEEEIVGYRDALNEIHSNHEKYQFSESDILDFHKVLISYTGFDYGGEYKKEDNVIIEMLLDGTRRVRFKPTSAKETSNAMNQLILAYMEARDDSSIPRLLLIPCVILDFLCIHPFSDGNGRISRLLSLLLLYKNDYEVGKFVSFENQINNTKFEYYEALRLSSQNWNENNSDYIPFIESFLKSLHLTYIELNNRFSIVNEKKESKKDRIEKTLMKSKNPISRQEIYHLWPDISQETIKKTIKNLLNEEKIEKIGNFKDARYKRK